MALVAASPPSELMGTSAFIDLKWEKPRDGAAEKKLFGLSFNSYE